MQQWESHFICLGLFLLMKKTWLNELAIWQARNAPPLKLPDNVAFAIGNEGDSVQYLVLQWVPNVSKAHVLWICRIHYAKKFDGNVRDFSGFKEA